MKLKIFLDFCKYGTLLECINIVINEYVMNLVVTLCSASKYTVSAYPNETKADRFAESLRTQ